MLFTLLVLICDYAGQEHAVYVQRYGLITTI